MKTRTSTLLDVDDGTCPPVAARPTPRASPAAILPIPRSVPSGQDELNRGPRDREGIGPRGRGTFDTSLNPTTY